MIRIIYILGLFYICLFANSYENAIDFYKTKQYKKAMDSFLLLTKDNDNRAMLAIGIMHINGDGVKRDLQKAIKWFKKSANAGNTYACNKLGNIFASKEQYKKAFKWFEKSAKKGNSEAAYNLGYFYTGGLGIKQNLKKSLFWYEKSALAGNINAQLNVAFMYIGGQGTKVDYQKAAKWLQKAKNAGSKKAKLMWEEFKFDDVLNNKTY